MATLRGVVPALVRFRGARGARGVLCLLAALGSASVVLAAGGGPTPASLASELPALALRAGLPGDDLSPVFLAEGGLVPPALRERPAGALGERALRDPGVRVHFAPTALPVRSTASDAPDRVEIALRTAARTLRYCRSIGLGSAADDRDRELDLYLVGLGGAVRGYVVLDTAASGRGALGFAVLDASPLQDDAAFEEMVARLVARLVLASHDASAPAFWLEPSVLWIAERITGTSAGMEHSVAARWNHPERGPFASDPLLQRGNLGLFWGLDDPDLAGHVLEATWSALGGRATNDDDGASAVDVALRQATGASLADLLLRTAALQVVTGNPPARWAARVQSLPLLDLPAEAPLAPLGVALVRVVPDPREPEGTRLTLAPAEPGWTAVVLARRRAGGWDKTTLRAESPDTSVSVTIPWNDYDQATVLVERPAASSTAATADGTFRLRAEPAERAGLYALSSFGARALPGNVAEITWSTAWEEGLFGWMVERAAAGEGPWEPVLATPVPALGMPHDGSDYIVQDVLPGARPRVFYRIVVLTQEGLRVTGPSVAVRTR